MLSLSARRLTFLVAVVAAAWCVATLAFVLIHAAVNGLVFTGAYAGYFPGDQLRYLAWIREAGLHGLIADPYHAGSVHDYLHPLFLISGLLWRAGLSIQAAYLVWTPVALAVLIWGYASFTGRFLAGRERAAALALALLFVSPLVPLFDYGGIVDRNGAYYLIVVAGHGVPYWQAWGYLPTVIALGLMPIVLLGVDAHLAGRMASGRLLGTALAGLLVAWFHPWGGIELLVIVGALLALRRLPPNWKQIALVGLATALPLIYYAVLAGRDSAWSLAQLRSSGNSPLWWPLIVDFGPLLLLAWPARRWLRDPGQRLLVLWLLSVLAVYLALRSDARDTALEGLSLPLAIIAVRGWRALRLPRGWSYAALVLAILPGAFYSAHTFRDTFYDRNVPFALAPGEQQAVDAVARLKGKILATRYLASALPALAGRRADVSPLSDALFDAHVPSGRLRRSIANQQIQVIVSDCLPGRPNLSASLGLLGFRIRRYGCASLYGESQMRF